MKAGTGLVVVVGIVLTAVTGYVLFTMFGDIGGLTVVPGLLVSVLFGGPAVTAAANVHRIAPKPRTCI